MSIQDGKQTNIKTECMTTNEKNLIIANWLKLEVIRMPLNADFLVIYKDNKRIILDFAGDRNQQKWIEDELIKKGYMVVKVLEKENAFVRLAKVKQDIKNFFESIEKENDKPNLDTAFIEAVLELIEKE
jgi:hypothetical protein